MSAVMAVLERRWDRLPATRVHPAIDDLSEVLTPWRARSVVLNLIAMLCLPLAGIGVSGAVAYSVRSRTREHAIHLALGAEPALVRRSVVRQAMSIIGAGLAIGLLGGFAAGRVMRSVLFEVWSFDVLTVVVVLAAVCGVGWLAALGPARRASNVEPAIALREGWT
jgi:ABC-type antimicrobial peptide transport system permease subunit